MPSQNIYDNETFFERYKELRTRDNNFNILIEQPAMKELLPDLNNKTILDLGCGYGNNCADFISRGAKKVIGIDISSKMLSLAKSENNLPYIEYIQYDMSNLQDLNLKYRFDFVYSSLAFHYINDLSKLLKDIHNLLNTGGHLLFSQEHPFITASINGGYWIKNEYGDKTFYAFSDYCRIGERKSFWFVEGVIKYHRTVSNIITSLAKSGFMIEQAVEPTPSDFALSKNPAMAKEFNKPNFLIIKAMKIQDGEWH